MESAVIEKEALKLPPRERALLADRLLQTLSQPDEDMITQAWAAKAEDRLTAFRKGNEEAIDGPKLIASIRQKLG